jgi:putative DNA primase/helicase
MSAVGYNTVAGTPSPVFAEVDIADDFAKQHAHELRYVAEWGRWMKYDGQCWREERTLLVFDLIRNLCKELARESNNKSEIKTIKSAKTIAAVERIAKADRRIAATTEQWDADPWLLNTPDGVVDLRTGKVRSLRPDDYMTRMTLVGPQGECPMWKAHLNLIMNGDKELVAYLQRAFGYSLTGITREHALFFAHGTGANGKGTTFETIAKIMGSYARSAPMKTFTASKIEEHPTELAMLRGARMVMASETEEGRSWAEARIKQLTGGDRIPARFMRQDYFEFTPQFKLWIQGNHKPALRSVDEAIRRRFNLLPFTITIPREERDQKFAEDKLTKEHPGILAWMIQGCLKWQSDGLCPPQAVSEATAEYLKTEDALMQWFAESCVVDASHQGLFTSELYASFKQWLVDAGELVISRKRFSQRLEVISKSLGIEKVEDLQRDKSHGRGFLRVWWKRAAPRDGAAGRVM